MFINTFRYTPEDVDCRLCTAFIRKDGCTAPRCLYLAERIEAGVVGYDELLRESFPADSVFRWRLRMLLETFDGTLWQNEKHVRRMETQQAVNRYYKRRDTPKYYAVLYLLTSDNDVYRRAAQCFTRRTIDFRKIQTRGASHHAYAVIAAARSIYEGTEQVTAADLAIPEVVPLSAFRLIIHALLVARYGLDVLKITKKAA